MSATADIHSDAQHLMVWAYGDTLMSNESDGNGNLRTALEIRVNNSFFNNLLIKYAYITCIYYIKFHYSVLFVWIILNIENIFSLIWTVKSSPLILICLFVLWSRNNAES